MYLFVKFFYLIRGNSVNIQGHEFLEKLKSLDEAIHSF